MSDPVRSTLLDALGEDELRAGAADTLAKRSTLILAQLVAGDLRKYRAHVARLQAKLATLARLDPDA